MAPHGLWRRLPRQWNWWWESYRKTRIWLSHPIIWPPQPGCRVWGRPLHARAFATRTMPCHRPVPPWVGATTGGRAYGQYSYNSKGSGLWLPTIHTGDRLPGPAPWTLWPTQASTPTHSRCGLDAPSFRVATKGWLSHLNVIISLMEL